MSAVAGNDRRWIAMGRIGSSYGVKGWVRLTSYTDPRDNLLSYRHFRAVSGERVLDLEMDQGRRHGKGLIGHMVGYDAPETARELTGAELQVAAEDLPPLDEDEYYWFQLVGLRVHTSSGHCLGTVTELMETGANDVLVIVGDEASVDRRRRLIPFLPDQVVLRVDRRQGTLLVDWEPDWL